METKTIINELIDNTPDVKCGQMYQDVSKHGFKRVYLVGSIDIKSTTYYCLINLQSGYCYGNPSENIEDIFECDRGDFILFSEVVVTLIK